MSLNKILIANGVNLDLLGNREPDIYGTFNLVDLENQLVKFTDTFCKAFGLHKPQLEFFQSNSESKFIEKCAEAYDAIIINAGAWTHTSLALADRLKGVKARYIEVHISNVHAREEFRHKSFLSPGSAGVVSGCGLNSYTAALTVLLLS